MTMDDVEEIRMEGSPVELTPAEKGAIALAEHSGVNWKIAPEAIKAAYRKYAEIVLDAQ
jgi:hypothetical protein